MDNIHWIGHASFLITGEKQIYIDPFMLGDHEWKPANIVFVTHAHQDHLSSNDIKKVLQPSTIVVAPPDCLAQLELDETHKVAVLPTGEYVGNGLSFSTIPAYNTDISKQQFHPRSNNWVGFIILVNGQKIYHAGDTDYIPEMDDLASQSIDVALLPMGGTYTMEASETARAANAIKAKVTVPMHYKRLLGEKAHDAEELLKTNVTNSQVHILQGMK